jgi:hypothetical protein
MPRQPDLETLKLVGSWCLLLLHCHYVHFQRLSKYHSLTAYQQIPESLETRLTDKIMFHARLQSRQCLVYEDITGEARESIYQKFFVFSIYPSITIDLGLVCTMDLLCIFFYNLLHMSCAIARG